MAKVCFLDVETTGRDTEKNSIRECSVIIELDGKFECHRTFYMRPKEDDPIDREWLIENGVDIAEMYNHEFDQQQGKVELQNMFSIYVDPFNTYDKMYFVGYNAKFDWDFMQNLWKDCGDTYFHSFFWNPYIDVMTICMWLLQETRPFMKNFRLGTVAEAVGIKFDPAKAHKALYDARITRAIYRKLEEGLE